MRYVVTQHTQRNGIEFYTVQKYSLGIIPRGYVYGLDESQTTYDFKSARRFPNEAQANAFIDIQSEKAKAAVQTKHDNEIIRSKVVQDRDIR